jgi:hypothetical protein
MLKATQTPVPSKNKSKEIKKIVKYISFIINLFSFSELKKLDDEKHR